MHISFLSAPVALTKTFTKHIDGSIGKDAYPMVKNFTSHTKEVETPLDLFKVIKAHADKGHCAIKGQLKQDLVNEPRKGMTDGNDPTEWICLDFDRVESASVQDELAKLNCSDVACVVQWSSSHNMPGNEGTISAHVFMLLDRPMLPADIKLWLQNVNFTHYDSKIKLSDDHNALIWPLDVTTCQNDKLLYIATPRFKNMKDPIGDGRIEYVKGKHQRLPISRMGQIAPAIAAEKCKAKKNELRKALGLKATNAGTTWVGEYEVTNKPSVANVTGVKDCDEYIRLNLNGGESWAWWHFKENYELLFSFKTEDVYRTKDIVPKYYASLQAQAAQAISTPTAGGDIVLGFSELATAKYFRGTWNEATQKLDLHEARSETQVYHWYLSHGLTQPAFIPIWNMTYDIKADYVVDVDNNMINMFRKSEYMRTATPRGLPIKMELECPTINRVINHMLGNDPVVIDAFTKWFACIFQNLGKPKTAWLGHGDEGTGKGTWFDLIATPLLGEHNVIKVDINAIEDGFNAWMKNKLLIMVDEIDVDDFKEKGRASNIFKSRITENTFPCRDMRATTYSYPNTFQFFFASNKKQPVYIPKGDRRYNVGRYQAKKLIISDHERDVLIPKELATYAQHLMNQETSVAIATEICDTEDRRRISDLSVSSHQEVANMIIDGDFNSLWGFTPTDEALSSISNLNEELAYASAYQTCMREHAQRIVAGERKVNISRDHIAVIFKHTLGKKINASPNTFTSHLRHLGIVIKPIRIDAKVVRGIETKWVVSDELLKELTEYLQSLKPRAVIRPLKPIPQESTDENTKASRVKRSNS